LEKFLFADFKLGSTLRKMLPNNAGEHEAENYWTQNGGGKNREEKVAK
jgi:hypothetical protein